MIRVRSSSRTGERKLFTSKVRIRLLADLIACNCYLHEIPLHSAANNEVERQSWVTALELAKAKAIRAIESEEEEEDSSAHAIPSEELNTVVRDLSIK